MFDTLRTKLALKRLKRTLKRRSLKHEEIEGGIRIQKITEDGFNIEAVFKHGEIRLNMDGWHKVYGIKDRKEVFHLLMSSLSKESRLKVVAANDEAYFFELQHFKNGEWIWHSQMIFIPKDTSAEKTEKYLQNDIIES
jgi:hypothetical protein